MATTRLTDIVAVKTFNKIVEGKLAENSRFRQSNVVSSGDARINKLVSTAGFETTMPFWRRPAGAEATSQNDDPDNKATPSKVTQGNMVARILSRTLSFSAMDISDFASDSDAIAYAAGELARLRVADEEKALLSILTGVIAAGGADYKVAKHITSGTIGAGNVFGVNALLDGRRKLGDKGGDLKTLVIHSDVVNNLRAVEPNSFIPASQSNLGLERYMGWNIIETDNVGKAGSGNYPIYTTYEVGPELFNYASGNQEHALVQFRDELAGGGSGQETILNRFRYALHLYGVSNVAPPANGVSQTNAELANSATWSIVAQDRKDIPLVAITTNG